MRRAIALSHQNIGRPDGGPFGAVIVKDGRIIGEGTNQVTGTNDPTAHAEMVAIRAAAATLDSFRLEGCEIYTSCEPCPMCLSAIYWARLDRMYYANTREDAAKVGFDDDLIYVEVARPIEDRHIQWRQIVESSLKRPFDCVVVVTLTAVQFALESAQFN